MNDRRDLPHGLAHVRAGLFIVAAATCTMTRADELSTSPIPGTYEIRICRSSCMAGEEATVISGHVVLFSAVLTSADITRLHSSSGHRDGPPNACFVLQKMPGRKYRGYAGIDEADLTSWSVENDELQLTLFRSPDAGYRVTLRRSPNGFHGTGLSWGAGAAAALGAFPDDVLLHRIGDADVRRCRPKEAAQNQL